MSKVVVGWCDTYGSGYSITTFTEERKRALVERIRKRRYNFNYSDYQSLPYCCPMYDDDVICILTKQQFDNVMNEAWNDMPRGARLIPMDAITIPVKNGVLYEKEKFIKEGKE